eukprot:TRINITY_DN136606_c0_g1_i1.p1 TRINITY_DN136606_c0_g1~~TRINITY_DN136606_c0_g1_i1.p1  ORF type:complete len:68 (-),score=27.50 TRINITY_DN136606_c0_g1_i1:85-288(-)
MSEEVDVSTLTEEERQIYEKYGKVPKKTDILKKRNERLRGGNHQKFDSADWALKKSQEQQKQEQKDS